MENKALIISTLTALAVGGVAGYLLTPTKIETHEIEKEVTKKIFLDRVITKVTKPDGTIEERTEEKDRSVSYERTEESSKTETNPKRVGVAVLFKSDLESTPTKGDVGVQGTYDTGFFNTYVTGELFLDKTITVGLGVKF